MGSSTESEFPDTQYIHLPGWGLPKVKAFTWLSHCLRQKRVGAALGGGRTAAPFLPQGIATPPQWLAPSCWSPPTLQAALPVQRPSQAQAGLWFISAAPAASLSRLVNRGSRRGRRRGPLWAMSGFRALLVPVLIFSPRKLGSGLPDMTSCTS